MTETFDFGSTEQGHDQSACDMGVSFRRRRHILVEDVTNHRRTHHGDGDVPNTAEILTLHAIAHALGVALPGALLSGRRGTKGPRKQTSVLRPVDR